MKNMTNDRDLIEEILMNTGEERAPVHVEDSLNRMLQDYKRKHVSIERSTHKPESLSWINLLVLPKARWAAVFVFALVLAVVLLDVPFGKRKQGVAFATVLNQIQQIQDFSIVNKITVIGKDNPPSEEDLNIERIKQSCFEKLKEIPLGTEEYLGQAEYKGNKVSTFRVSTDNTVYTIWAENETGKPSFIQIDSLMQNPLPLQIDGFVFDSKNLKIQIMGDVSEMEDSGNEFLKNQENLKELGVTVAESLFQVVSVKNLEKGQRLVIKDEELSAEKALIPALKLCAEMNDGIFYNDFFTSTQSTSEMDSTLKRAVPIEQLGTVLRAQIFIKKNTNNDWHLEMDRIHLGSLDPICWWRPEGSDTYKVIYGDLSVADVSANDFVQEN